MAATAQHVFLRASDYRYYFESYAPKHFAIVYACHKADIRNVQELLPNTHFSAVELLECVIDKWGICKIEIFAFLLGRITPDEMKRTFIASDENEYTLLTYFCHMVAQIEFSNKPSYMFKEKLLALLQHGADLNQVIGENTALSYLVRGNAVETVQLCIEMGANPHLGYLLNNAVPVMSESQHHARIAYMEKQKALGDEYPLLPKNLRHEVWGNNDMILFLCGLGLDPNKIQPSTGMNALIATCSSGNVYALDILLTSYKGLFHLDKHTKTPEGLTAMDWAMRRPQRGSEENLLVYCLKRFINREKEEINNVMYWAHREAIDNATLPFSKCGARHFKENIVGEFLLPGGF